MSELVDSGQQAQVGGAIRRVRRQADLTLRQVADAIGVSVGTMSAIENNKVGLTVARLQQVAEALGVEGSSLVTPPLHNAGPFAPSGARDVFEPLHLDPVLTAAVAVFRRTGYHGATMRSIASEADMSVAGIYHRYPSKQSLLVALVDLVMGDLVDCVSAAGGSEDPAERLHDMVEALALFHATRVDVTFIVGTETRSLGEADRRRVAEARRRIQELLDRAAVEGAEAGVFRTPDPRRTARSVSTLCLALPNWYSSDKTDSPQAIAREYADLALTMMQHVGPQRPS